MAITLELRPEVEAAARAEARSRGVGLESYLQALLEHTIPAPSEDPESIRRQRLAVLGRLQGKYAGLMNSEEFSARKQEEKAREERDGQSAG
jgi:hypothetical protein